ncbi:mutator type transposase, partial [Tanacetum coccineum]
MINGDKNAVSGDENVRCGDENVGSGDENAASGDDNVVNADENDASGDENDNVEGVEDIVDDEHIIDQIDVNGRDDLEVIDYDAFESDLDKDDTGSTRRDALRKSRKM